jgi:hypothetical protein
MIDEEVRTHELDELPGCHMVSDSGKTHTGGNATGPAQGAKKGSLWNTETAAPLEHIARTVMFRQIERRIRVIADVVTYRQIEFYRHLDGIFAPPDDSGGIVPNARMIAIDGRSGSQIAEVFRIRLHRLFINF